MSAAGAQGRTAYPPLPAGPAPEVALNDVVERVALDSSGSLYRGPITLVGFVHHVDGATDIAHIYIICCAADAVLDRVHLVGLRAAAASSLPENTWIRVRGSLIAPPESAEMLIASLNVTDLETIPPPRTPYG